MLTFPMAQKHFNRHHHLDIGCMQAASKALSLQMQQLQQQVADGMAAAASLQKEKKAAAEKLQQVGHLFASCLAIHGSLVILSAHRLTTAVCAK